MIKVSTVSTDTLVHTVHQSTDQSAKLSIKRIEKANRQLINNNKMKEDNQSVRLKRNETKTKQRRRKKEKKKKELSPLRRKEKKFSPFL